MNLEASEIALPHTCRTRAKRSESPASCSNETATENDYDREMSNGDLGRVQRIDQMEGVLVADIDDREVEYRFGGLDTLLSAFATTIQNSQGSEYPAVVITIEPSTTTCSR